jgi:nitrile hydratase accessory protein
LSPPDRDPIGPLARRDGEPVFDEPWQAQALATAFTLVENGLFSRQAWSDALGAELRRAERAGAPDTAETYYRAVVAALERLVAEGGTASAETLAERREAWRRAYLETPHGQPVILAGGIFEPAGD